MAFDTNAFINNPWTNIGLGILGSNVPGASFGQAVGGGGLLGLQSYQQAQAYQARMDALRREQEREEQERIAARQQQKYLEQWLSTQPPEIQQMYRANPKLAMKVLEEQYKGPDVPTGMRRRQDGSWVYDQAYLQGQERLRRAGAINVNTGMPKPPAGYEWGANNELQPIKGGPAEKPSEAQLGAALFADLMHDAENTIQSLYSQGWEPTIWERARGASNYTATPEMQQMRQAQESWVAAKLRKESGAAISPAEMESQIRIFFPQPGDSEAVIKRKARQRELATRGMERQAGSAYQRERGNKPKRNASSDGAMTTDDGWSIETVE